MTYNTMAKDISKPKVLKHNKEQDMQYNSQRYKTNKSPKNTTKSRTYNTMAKDIRQTKVLKHNKEQDILSLAIVLYVLLFVVFYKTNKGPKTQQRA